MAGGAWGSPNRWTTLNTQPGIANVTGSWDRSVSIFRAQYTHVTALSPDGKSGTTHFAPHAALT